MSYWDWIRTNHRKLTENYPSGPEGFHAIDLLTCVFEHTSSESLGYDHPLHNRFIVGMESNYRWLVQYARKVITASHLKGYEGVAARLGDSKTFMGANNEMEVALKLSLEGLEVAFVKTGTIPTPDIVASVQGQSLHAEVSSLNRPDYEAWHMRFINHVMDAAFRNRLTAGGYLVAARSLSKTEDAIRQVDEAAKRVAKSGKMEKLNIPGITTLYLAPQSDSPGIPEDCRGSYRFTGPSPRPLQEQIIRKIEEKADQISADGNSGILVLYSYTVRRESVIELFEASMDEVEVVLAAHPRIMALILTVPHMHIGVTSNMKEEASEARKNGNKVLLSSEVGVYQYESSLIWKNPHSDQPLPAEVLHAFENYPKNLVKLLPLGDA